MLFRSDRFRLGFEVGSPVLTDDVPDLIVDVLAKPVVINYNSMVTDLTHVSLATHGPQESPDSAWLARPAQDGINC